jgi:hypothetical protein
MGTIKPDTSFIRLLLLSQSLLGRENSVRIKREMRHSSTSAVVALSGLRQNVHGGETVPLRIKNRQLIGNF